MSQLNSIAGNYRNLLSAHLDVATLQVSWAVRLVQSPLLCVAWSFAIVCCRWLEHYHRYKIESNFDTQTKYENPNQQLQNGQNKSTKQSILKCCIMHFVSGKLSDYVSIVLVENRDSAIVLFFVDTSHPSQANYRLRYHHHYHHPNYSMLSHF